MSQLCPSWSQPLSRVASRSAHGYSGMSLGVGFRDPKRSVGSDEADVRLGLLGRMRGRRSSRKTPIVAGRVISSFAAPTRRALSESECCDAFSGPYVCHRAIRATRLGATSKLSLAPSIPGFRTASRHYRRSQFRQEGLLKSWNLLESSISYNAELSVPSPSSKVLQ